MTYSDSDYAGEKDRLRSTGAYVVMMGGGAVDWSSKVQSVVAQSTTEAEYIAGVHGGKEAVWLRQFLKELGFPVSGPTTLLVDNQSAIAVTRNPEHHGRMKHLDVRHFWLRDVVKAGVIDVRYISTKDMPADIMTKSLPKATVENMRAMVGLRL